MLVTVVHEADGTVADVEITKEWATLDELRQEVGRLKNEISQLNWQLTVQEERFNERSAC